MITPKQVYDLADYYQIDSFTIFREYLQLVFLNYLYQQKKATKIYFKGGTAIHLLFGSPRFSQDLDFSTTYDQKQIRKIIKTVKKEIEKELAQVKILLLYQCKKSIRFRLKYQSEEFKYPFVIRLDFSQEERVRDFIASPIVARFPLILFPVVSHLSPQEILAEKIRAFLTRAKGIDIFDIWFLLEKGIELDNYLVEKKLKEVGRKFEQEKLVAKIKNYSLKKIELDLKKFLPQPQRKIITIFKGKLVKILQSQK